MTVCVQTYHCFFNSPTKSLIVVEGVSNVASLQTGLNPTVDFGLFYEEFVLLPGVCVGSRFSGFPPPPETCNIGEVVFLK